MDWFNLFGLIFVAAILIPNISSSARRSLRFTASAGRFFGAKARSERRLRCRFSRRCSFSKAEFLRCISRL